MFYPGLTKSCNLRTFILWIIFVIEQKKSTKLVELKLFIEGSDVIKTFSYMEILGLKPVPWLRRVVYVSSLRNI